MPLLSKITKLKVQGRYRKMHLTAEEIEASVIPLVSEILYLKEEKSAES